MTRLNRIHPYPAMVADALGGTLAGAYVGRDARVLDPFCGTGRLLMAAAEREATCVGVDVNPLATLITRAKFTRPSLARLAGLRDRVALMDPKATGRRRDITPDSTVAWYTELARKELSQLIDAINEAPIGLNECIVAGAILSATALEVSFCRKDQWKLHRLPGRVRSSWRVKPTKVFLRRMSSYIEETRSLPKLLGRGRAELGDARVLHGALQKSGEDTLFDLVMTSPPYGDSRTTVAYGAMSAMCLGVVRHLEKLRIAAITAGEIDGMCLGGSRRRDVPASENVFAYWKGGKTNPGQTRVKRFLADIQASFEEIATVVRPGGHVVILVGRRRVCGFRVYLDRFIEHVLRKRGLHLVERRWRRVVGKITPSVIHRRGRWADVERRLEDRVPTMRVEFTLVFGA
jgi:site-specific DNA-methyltransferase (cytosine-N4-specific)